MGYRDRQAHRQQQKEQSLGQGYTAEQRVNFRAPSAINLRDGTNLPEKEATYLLNAFGTDDGVRLMRQRSDAVYMPIDDTSPLEGNCNIITYDGCGSASAEAWVIYHQSASALEPFAVANIGEIIDGGIAATASATSCPITDGNQRGTSGSWIEFNKTIIYVAGTQGGAAGTKWTRASGWTAWSVSVSGGSALSYLNHWGINSFKNRIFTWQQASAAFTYGSVDQIEGTLHTFNLGGVLGEDLMLMTSMTRDGGSGPDDFAVFIGVNGRVAVYQGIDPGDANNWSLVGVYQIGRPISKNCAVKYGSQVLVACEDDIYILPDDLSGVRRATKWQRKLGTSGSSFYGNKTKQIFNAIYEPSRGLILFGDGTTLNANRNLEGSHTQYKDKEPYKIYGQSQQTDLFTNLGVYKNRIFGIVANTSAAADTIKVIEIDPPGSTKFSNNKIYTGKLQTTGRTNISLVNPVFRKRNRYNISTTASTPQSFVYRVAAVYDDELLIETSLSADRWLTASGELTGTDGQWLPLAGTGDGPQIALEVLSASSSADFVFTEIKATVSDTGDI